METAARPSKRPVLETIGRQTFFIYTCNSSTPRFGRRVKPFTLRRLLSPRAQPGQHRADYWIGRSAITPGPGRASRRPARLPGRRRGGRCGSRRIAGATARRRCRRPASRSSCVPSSTMRPRSSTTSRSMLRSVDSRCAIAMTVRPSISSASCSWIAASTSGIERRGRLVEHQDRRVLQDHPGERDALALAAGQFDAALADMRVEAGAAVPVLQPLDEFERVRAPRRVDDLRLARLGPAVADVVADRAVQQRGVLRHHADLRPQALLGQPGDVAAVDQDAAPFRPVEAEEQVHQVDLPAPERPTSPTRSPGATSSSSSRKTPPRRALRP